MPAQPFDGKQLFMVMRAVFQEHTARWTAEVHGLTKPQFAVLIAVAERPGIEQGHLVTAAAISKATLAELLARMEDRGLIRREVDPNDSRRRLVRLTEQGEHTVQAALPVADRLAEELLAELDAAERVELLGLLERMRPSSA